MNIALCSPMSISYYGGAEKQICQIAHLLHDNGYEVNVYALPFAHTGRKVQVDDVLEVPYHESWRHSISADVSYVYYQPFYWRLFSINGKKIAGMHSIETFYPVPIYSRKYWAFKVIGYPDLSSFDAVRTLNPSLLVRHHNIYCISDWIDTSQYQPFNEKLDKFSILYVGRHTKWKGWPVYKKVCHELERRGYNFNFFSTGKGDNLIKGLGMILGGMPSLYSKCHILVHPSRADTFGLSIAESLACKTPVITTPLLMHRALNMPLFYAWTEEAFLNKILNIYNLWRSNYSSYNKLCNNIRKSVERYDVNTVFPHFEKMLLDVHNI